MKWIIENNNGSLIFEGHEKFKIVDKTQAIRTYFIDNKKNRYGFEFNSGIFFINNILFNMNIDLNNYVLEPICTKSGLMLINQQNHENKLYSCNIGYKLVGQEDSYEYIMSIFYNGEVGLAAKHFKNNILVDQRNIQLQ